MASSTTSRLAPPLQWHGSKHYLANRIIELMPSHTHYVEPYAGGLAVLLAKNPNDVSEVVNDIHRDLTNFWQVLQDKNTFKEFLRIVAFVPFSELEWHQARDGLKSHPGADPVRRAVWFFILCRQSWWNAVEGLADVHEQVSAWWNAVEGLPDVHDRMKRVVVLNGPALEVIRKEDGPDTLIYADPPYASQTRTASDVYLHEMSEADHRELLALVRACKGKVMLSGYACPLYDNALAGWTRHTFDLPNNAASGKTKGRETEVLWCNFSADGSKI